MPKVIVEKSKFLIKHFRGKAIGIVRPRGGGGGAEGGVAVMNSTSLNIHEVGDVFVTVVEVVGEYTGGWEENQRPGGDGLRGVPDVGLIRDVVDTAELLDAKEVFVEETLLKVGSRRNRAHGDATAQTIEDHRDFRVAGAPMDGAILGIVQNRPNARLGLDEGLVSVRVVLGHEVVNRRVLIEVVGGVGLALGGRAVSHLAYARGRMYSDVIVDIGLVLSEDKLIADVVGMLTVVDKNTTATEEGCPPL